MGIIEAVKQVAALCGYLTCIIGALSIVIKPLREKLFSFNDAQKSIQCILRTLILQTYYSCRATQTIHYYELENVLKLYEAYKQTRGNSFVHEVIEEIEGYKVIE